MINGFDFIFKIAESSREYVLGEIIHKNCKVEVIISCEPECIKTDYNGN